MQHLKFVTLMVVLVFIFLLSGVNHDQAWAGICYPVPGVPCVDSSDIINGQVNRGDLKNNAVNSAKVLDNSLAGADIQDGTITGADIASPLNLTNLNVSGKLGIRTTTPISVLTVYDNTTVEYGLRVDKVTTGGNSQAVSALNTAVPSSGYYSHAGFFQANSNAVAFGNKVGVRGQALGTGTNYGGYFLATGGDYNYGAYFWAPTASADYAIYVGGGKSYFSGNVGIGTTAPGYKLQVGNAGDGTEARANAWNLLSSRAYKKDIQSLKQDEYENILEKVRNLDVVRYRFINDDDNEEHLGVIAEESPEEILSKDRTSVSMGDYVAFLLGALKAQQAKIEALETKIQELGQAKEILSQ